MRTILALVRLRKEYNEFKSSLSRKVRSRLAWATEQGPVSKNKKQKQKNK
jgi:hypothetical protein